MEALLNRKTPVKAAPASRRLVSEIEELDKSAEKVVLHLGSLTRRSVVPVKSNYKLDEQAAISRHMDSLARNIERLKELLEPFQMVFAKGNAAELIQQLVAMRILVTSAELIESLNWSKQALSKALAANRVFYVEQKGTRYFPAFFADSNYDRKHFEAISKVLGELPGSAKLQFFYTGKGSLGGVTPLEGLRAGKLSAVKVAAQGFVER